jgi:hypothetical protein
MPSLRGLPCIGVLVLATACAQPQAPVTEAPPTPTEAPAVLPVEAEPDAVVEAPTARPSPERLLGLSFEDPLVRDFVGDAKLEEETFGDVAFKVAPEQGFDLRIEGGVITTVFLHALGHEDHRQYAGELPGGIQFGDSPDAVQELLGASDARGAGGAWDKWYSETWSLHVQYSAAGGVALVTVTTAQTDPQRN